jgi:hypothetical protein
MMPHPIITVPFLLHFLLQPIKLQLGLIVCVDFMSPYDLCLSPFYLSFWKRNCYKFKSLQQLFCSNLNINNFVTNFEFVELEKTIFFDLITFLRL